LNWGLLRRSRYSALAIATIALASASVALASTGAISAKGCIADTGSNPDGCPKTASGLTSAENLAVSHDGKSVYVVAGGDNAVSVFKRDTRNGALTPAGCIGDAVSNPDNCAKTSDGLKGADDVVVSRDGTSVYVASYSANAVVVFKRNTKTGGLTPKGCVADPANNPSGCGQTTPGLDGSDALDISPDGKSLYVIGSSDDAVVMFKRNISNGALTAGGCFGDLASNPDGCAHTARALAGAQDLAVSPDGKSLYVADYTDGAIVSFKRNPSTGALTPNGCIGDPSYNLEGCPRTTPGISEPWDVAVSPDGKSVYLSDDGDSALVRFNRNTTSGALTPKGCIADPINNGEGCSQTAAGLDGGTGVAVSPDGKSVYTTGSGDHALVRFNRSSTGALTAKGCIAATGSNPDGCAQTAVGLGDPLGATASPDGKSVYTVGSADNLILRFARAP
jgi:DNA-binding beta-propeller fold protein YncE